MNEKASEIQPDFIKQRDLLLAEADVIQLTPALKSMREQAAGPKRVIESDQSGHHGPEVKREVGFFNEFGGAGVSIDDQNTRSDGDFRPIFQSETEIALIRGIGRYLGSATDTGIGILGNLSNYVVHTGFDFSVGVKRGSGDYLKLAEEAQKVVDEFLDYNDWNQNFQEEMFRESRIDGELLIALEDEGGQVKARRGEPSWLTEPNQHDRETRIEERLNYAHEIDWKYGVASKKGDPTERLGYFMQWNGDPAEWAFYPESKFVHLALNVPRNVKRGLSDFYSSSSRITGADELLSRIGQGAGIQASIALIIEQAMGSGSAVSPLTGGTNSTGANGVAFTDFKGGTVVNTKGNTFQAGPMAGAQAANFIQVLQAMLRGIGNRWNMPEHMVSGDASNGNYASILVAGSPFTRSIQTNQSKYFDTYKQMIFKVLRIAYKHGRFDAFGLPWSKIKEVVFIVIDGTNPEMQDIASELAVAESLYAKGALSARTFASRFNVDLDEESEIRAKDQAISEDDIAGAVEIATESLKKSGLLGETN